MPVILAMVRLITITHILRLFYFKKVNDAINKQTVNETVKVKHTVRGSLADADEENVDSVYPEALVAIPNLADVVSNVSNK